MALKKKPFRVDQALLANLLYMAGINKDNGDRFDAGETVFLARQLEYISATVYETVYPALLAQKFIPVNTSVPTGAQTWSYRMWDSFGMAKIIHSYADDLPRVGRMAKEFNAPIRSVGESYGYSIQDLRAAMFANVPLSADLAVVARAASDTKLDEIAAIGSADDGIKGFLNHANIPDAAGLTGSWATATPLEILGDLNIMQGAIVKATKQTITPDTVLFDQASWEIVNNTVMSDFNTMTVLQTFLKNSPYIRNADVWWRLDDADGGDPMIVMYARRPEVVEQIIPQLWEQFPPQMENLAFKVPCHARAGGVSLKYPLGAVYGKGV